ncbi:MAG TPA: molybdopterin-binding protein [Thermoanaerobaculia bacterium]
MRFGPVPLEAAEGRVLGHNVAGPDGRRALRKGRPLTAADIETLRALGRRTIYVADPEPDDVGEDEAARRVAAAAAGAGVVAGAPSAGRVNLLATFLGVLRVEADRVTDLNLSDGLTLSTLAADSPVRPKQVVATVKVIPYALPAATVARAEAAAAPDLLRVDPIPPRRVGLVLSGSAAAEQRIRRDFHGPLAARLGILGAELAWVDFVPLKDASAADEAALERALRDQAARGAEVILLAGETAIVDRHDIAPRAIERAGGSVEAFGAPVDPGNLLLLAYLGGVPVVGAPGCARSRKTNVIDAVLPRLLAGERLGRRGLASLGAGGLLEDVPERPMPRSSER